MYQALYRKYRPSNLDEIAGQEVIVKILKNAIKNNQISHAYLFCGPRGTGKTSIAKILAKIINCTNLNGITPCDNCENCISFNEKNTTDIIEIDAASNNGVDEIRELKNKINLVPNIGKYKIYIIDEVHMLTIGAFNALLKTLEEPPKHAIFILATTEPHKIPITILSRCQRLDFQKISVENIIDRLNKICSYENIEIETEALKQIAILSDGGMRDSISMLDKLISYTNEKITINDVIEINGIVTKEELEKFILDITDKQFKKIFETIDKFNGEGKNFAKLSEEIMKYLRDLLVDSLSFNNKSNLVEKIGYKRIIEYIEQFSEILNQIKLNSNPKIIMETNIIKLMIDSNSKNTEIKPEVKQVKEINPEQRKEKIKESETVKVSSDLISVVEQLKSIRINNTLSDFNKKILIECKTKLEVVQNFLIDPNFSEIAGLLLDGELKAASNKNLIFVYTSENISLNFNLKIKQVEQLLSKIGLTGFKVIATDSYEWNKIKEEFNSKTKTYEYIDDTNIGKDLYKEENINQKNSIENIFNDIIEYDK